jgi:hypothetical protein
MNENFPLEKVAEVLNSRQEIRPFKGPHDGIGVNNLRLRSNYRVRLGTLSQIHLVGSNTFSKGFE